MSPQAFLHGKAPPTASMATDKGLFALMVSQYVTLQVEVPSELFLTPFSGARQHPLLPRVHTQLMLTEEPGVAELLLAHAT